jgi:molecular chaperone GrpE
MHRAKLGNAPSSPNPMNPESEIKEVAIFGPEDQIDEIDGDSSPSVDEFLMELEAKEKDLHITADFGIEVADSDFDETAVPEFVKGELTVTGNSGEPIAGNAKSNGLKTRVFELEQELESMKNKLIALRMERNDVQEKSDRRLKDFESYKYRMDRERRGSVISQIGNLATQLLPVLDNLDRALDSIGGISEKKHDEFKQFIDGVALVNMQINEVLAGMGVEPIKTVGEIFDPHFHEAVSTEHESDLPPNTVAAEMLRGYRIGNLVIRHSMVRVTAAPPVVRSATGPLPEPTDPPANELPTDAESA